MKISVIDRRGNEHELELLAGEPMVNSLSATSLVEATCGGCCSCATCQIYVDTHWLQRLPEAGPDETALLSDLLNSRSNSRLACQLVATADMDGMRVTVAPEQ